MNSPKDMCMIMNDYEILKGTPRKIPERTPVEAPEETSGEKLC